MYVLNKSLSKKKKKKKKVTERYPTNGIKKLLEVTEIQNLYM